jgi:hypothetical protein
MLNYNFNLLIDKYKDKNEHKTIFKINKKKLDINSYY